MPAYHVTHAATLACVAKPTHAGSAHFSFDTNPCSTECQHGSRATAMNPLPGPLLGRFARQKSLSVNQCEHQSGHVLRYAPASGLCDRWNVSPRWGDSGAFREAFASYVVARTVPAGGTGPTSVMISRCADHTSRMASAVPMPAPHHGLTESCRSTQQKECGARRHIARRVGSGSRLYRHMAVNAGLHRPQGSCTRHPLLSDAIASARRSSQERRPQSVRS